MADAALQFSQLEHGVRHLLALAKRRYHLSGYAGDADHRFVFYDFRPSRSRDGPEEMLASYRHYLQTDGYVGLSRGGF